METLVQCVCGQFVKRKGMARHTKSNKHMKNMIDQVKDDILPTPKHNLLEFDSIVVHHAYDHDTCIVDLNMINI